MSADAPPPFTDAELPAYDNAPNAEDVALSIVTAEKGGDVLVSLVPPREPLVTAEKKVAPERAPVDIVCVIDVSGSMDSAATMPDEAGNQTATELSILDVVRHAMRTIKATLQPTDRLAIVTFHTDAQLVAPLTYMTPDKKTEMDTLIDGLRPLNSTNLWDGLKVAMDLLNGLEDQSKAIVNPRSGKGKHQKSPSMLKRFFPGTGGGGNNSPVPAASSSAVPEKGTTEKPEAQAAVPSDRANRIASIMLLTDGMPNVSPPGGELHALNEYFTEHPRSFSLTLAAAGGGQFCFIPDSGMVGTIFVHAVANIMATYAAVASLTVEAPGGSIGVEVLGDVKHVATDTGVKLELDLMYGQSRDVVIRFPSSVELSSITATASFAPWTLEAGKTSTVSASARPAGDAAARGDIKYHAYRLELAAALLSEITSRDNSLQQVGAIAKKIRVDSDLAGNANAIALAEDIEGQVQMALESNEYLQRWGRHYLLSLARAHQRQKCVNFKDAGQLVYGSDSPIFIRERDALDAAFDALPTPKPTRRTYGGRSSGVAVSSMKAMNSRYGPCVHGHSTVELTSGKVLRVEQLRRGMEVATAKGSRTVLAIVRTAMPSGTALLSGSSEWVFPADITSAEPLPCDAVYSILLSRMDGDSDAHAVTMNGGVSVIGLGHGVQDGILAHPFFANFDRVVQSLATLPSTEDVTGVYGCVGVSRGADGRVTSFLPETAMVDKANLLSLESKTSVVV
ncbi:Hh protein intein-like-domain-containing protein [Auriculariales sp. MPI-PUGE-AT-0066]|nr:Hh protein intein-like-domain-containing protein [Auriculariales sp. MPI-PUGE-AT-0066]